LALAGDYHDLAAVIIGALLAAIGTPIRLPNSRTEISIIDLDIAGQFGAAESCAHCFAEFVQQHESTLGVDIHVAAHAQRRMAFDAVAEERDHREVIADRQFPAMEDRTARHRDLRRQSEHFHRIGVSASS
jgi:hypothetical protein